MGISRDNRTAKRFRLNTRVDLRLRGATAGSGEAVNISLGGLLLVPGGILPVGSRCELAIALPAGSGQGVVVAEGMVVRSGEFGTAFRFVQGLGEMTLDVLAGAPVFRPGLDLPDYVLAYFKVGAGMAEFECLRTFGIGRRTFRRITTVSFFICLACALLVAWLGRFWIAGLPDWAKITGALAYGAAWLFVLHPAADLAVIWWWRGRGRR
jgi:hypothetical protein